MRLLPFFSSLASLQKKRRRAKLLLPVSAAIWTALITCTHTANADDDIAAPQTPTTKTAPDLFKEGLAQMEAGDFSNACPNLAESLKLAPMPGTLFTLAICESRWERLATADTRLAEYLRLYETLSPTQKATQQKYDRPKLVTKERQKIQSLIPMLTLTLAPNAPPGTIILHNGQAVDPTRLGIAMPVDPGRHTLSAQAPGTSKKEIEISIEKGQSKSITLETYSKPPPKSELPTQQKVERQVSTPFVPRPNPRSAPLHSQSSANTRTAAWTIGGVALASIGTSAVLGGITLSKASTVQEHCGKSVAQANPSKCDDIGAEAGQSLKPFATASTISLVLGAVGLGTAVILYTIAPSSPGINTTGRASHPQRTEVAVAAVGPSSILFSSTTTF